MELRGSLELVIKCTCMKSNWNLECWVLRRWETGEPGENPRSKDENQQQTQPTYDAGPGIEPGPHWWEASGSCSPRVLFSFSEIEIVAALTFDESYKLSFERQSVVDMRSRG